jgi:hypothetical protein
VIETGLSQYSVFRAGETCMIVLGVAEWSLVVGADGVVWISDDTMVVSSDWMIGVEGRQERLPI